MICTKCNIQLPNDSIFCPNWGCNLEEIQKEIVAEKKIEPEIRVVEKVVEKVVVKKNKINVVLVSLFILSIIACSVLGYFTFSFHSQVEEKEGIIKDYKNDLNDAKIIINELRDDLQESKIGDEIISTLTAYDNWGYATENFHTDVGIIVIDSYFSNKTVTLYSNYYDATFYLNNSNAYLIDVDWDEEYWNGNSTTLTIEPNYSATGVSVVTITNDKYDNEVNILVVVL